MAMTPTTTITTTDAQDRSLSRVNGLNQDRRLGLVLAINVAMVAGLSFGEAPVVIPS